MTLKQLLSKPKDPVSELQRPGMVWCPVLHALPHMSVTQGAGFVNVWMSIGGQRGQLISTYLPWPNMLGQLDTLSTTKVLVFLPVILNTILD